MQAFGLGTVTLGLLDMHSCTFVHSDKGLDTIPANYIIFIKVVRVAPFTGHNNV